MGEVVSGKASLLIYTETFFTEVKSNLKSSTGMSPCRNITTQKKWIIYRSIQPKGKPKQINIKQGDLSRTLPLFPPQKKKEKKGSGLDGIPAVFYQT